MTKEEFYEKLALRMLSGRVTNRKETKLIENGWLNNLMASIEAECAMMHSKQIAREKEINEILKELDD